MGTRKTSGNTRATPEVIERQYPDTIVTDVGPIRVTDLLRDKPNARVRIQGRHIPVSSIPLSIFTLDCGCKGKGIALSVGNVIFCEKHRSQQSVVDARS